MSLLKGRAPRSGGAAAAAPPAAELPPLPPPPPPAIESELWTDKYMPRTSSDLAVNKDKVAQVRSWLQKVDASLQLGLPPTPRLLILSGPPGSGKSALLHVLSLELGYELCEWVEPRQDRGGGAGAWWDAEHFGQSEEPPTEARSTAAQKKTAPFADFLRESLRTLSLSIAPASSTSSAGSSTASSAATAATAAPGMRRRLVVVDDLAPADAFGGGGSAGARSAAASMLETQLDLIRNSLLTARYL